VAPRDIIITPSPKENRSQVKNGTSILIILRPHWAKHQGQVKDLAEILHDVFPVTAITIRIAWEIGNDSLEVEGFKSRTDTEGTVLHLLAGWYLSLGEDLGWNIGHDSESWETVREAEA
jgi:hypothetical protein